MCIHSQWNHHLFEVSHLLPHITVMASVAPDVVQWWTSHSSCFLHLCNNSPDLCRFCFDGYCFAKRYFIMSFGTIFVSVVRSLCLFLKDTHTDFVGICVSTDGVLTSINVAGCYYKHVFVPAFPPFGRSIRLITITRVQEATMKFSFSLPPPAQQGGL